MPYLSLPRENVLLVPSRNVLLTGSGWGGGNRSPSDDPEGPRPIGRVEEGAEAADHATRGGRGTAAERAARAAVAEEAEAARRSRRAARPARTSIQSTAERKAAGEGDPDSLAGSLSWVRSHAGRGVLSQEAWVEDRPRNSAEADDRGPTLAGSPAEGGDGACVEGAETFTRGDGAVGHLRSRLAGRPRGEVLSDPHDRRRHQRADGALCRARFYRGEHAAAEVVFGASWPAGGVLHRQGEPVPDRAQDPARSEAVAARPARALATDTDWPRAARAGYRMDRGALPAGQGPRGTQFPDCPGPAGQGAACGGSEDPGTSQPVSTRRVRAVVEPASETAPQEPHRCSSSAGARARSGCDPERGGNPPSHPGLHDSLRERGLPDWARGHSRRIARGKRACGGSSGQFAEGSLSRSLSGGEPMPAAAQAHRCRLNPAQIVLAPGPVPGLAAESGPTLLSFRNTPMEGRPHRSHPHFRFLGGMKPVRRAKPARRSSRLKMQSLRSEVSPAAERVPNRKALRASRPVDPSYLVALEGLRRLLPEPTPSPRLCINRLGATPSGHVHPNMPSRFCPSKPDISTWHRLGHFYLALTRSSPATILPGSVRSGSPGI